MTDQLNALRHAAGLARLEAHAFLRFTGQDRARWLNGMATNNVAAIATGEGNYNFFLNAQGRIQGDGYLFNEGESFLLETESSQCEKLQQLLDHFIIMDDVELTRALDDHTGLILIGPNAPALLTQLNLPTPAPLHIHHAPLNGTDILLIAAHAPTVTRYELWAAPATTAALEDQLKNAGATPVDAATLEALRILEGTPLYGADIRDRDLPQETAQDRALHFTKGCYLGQEIVERIRSRGAVHRTFTGFTLEGQLPTLPAALEADSKPAGELTSAVTLPNGTHLALGYARREALDRNLPFLYPGGRATPTQLPFQNL